MKRIYLKAFTYQNFGDDLFVRILCERYPDVHFYINCSRFHDDAFENIKNLTILNRAHLWGCIINNIKKILDYIPTRKSILFHGQVYIGGSIFIQSDDWYEDSSYERELYTLHLNIPYFILGANFGPFDDNRFVDVHKEYFRTVLRDICFRDKWSYNIFRELPNCRYAPDIVLTYKIDNMPKKELIVISCICNDGRIGGPVVNNQLYINKMVQICSEYMQMGKRVCLVSMCSGQGDEEICRAIWSRCKQKPEAVFYRGNIDEIINLFAESAYVIASRFHAMILAWITRTPVFPISYSDKIRNVIESYGFSGKYVTIRDFSSVDFETVDANRKQQYIFDVADICREAEKQFETFDSFIKDGDETNDKRYCTGI